MKHLKLWERPSHYFGQSWKGWYVGLGQHRDSDILTRSNFNVFLKRLKELPEIDVDNRVNAGTYWDEHDIELEAHVPGLQVPHETHFLCGWVEWIAIHESNTAALELAESMLAKLESYPILDETDYSNLEHDEILEYWKSMSIRGRIEVCAEAETSIFASRRDHPE